MQTQNLNVKSARLLPYLLLLTGAFIAWQLLYVMTCQSTFVIVAFMFEKHFALPLSLLPNLIYFVGAQLFLYSLFVLFVWSASKLFSSFWKFSDKQTWWTGICLWGVCVFSMLLLNMILYPQSIFSDMILNYIPVDFIFCLFFIFLKIILFVLLFSVIELIRKLFTAKVIVKIAIVTFVIVASVVMMMDAHKSAYANKNKTVMNEKPNIVIIGLDAIRPDRIHYNGYLENETPAIDNFLKQSTDFKLSLTPLARTYAAWVSILSGQYPRHNGVRYNLYRPKNFNFDNTLASILRRHGYYTVYAIDDTQFSHITPEFGFNKVIGIQDSADNFLLTLFNDSPLSNLVTNTRLGKVLFPYGFGNRAASVTYDPDSFIHLVSGRLSKNHHQPIFLAVHFCLAHWPYTWSTTHATGSMSNSELYDLAVHRVDGQFSYFMKVLKQDGLLNNAIVVLLSDHGEAFLLPGDRMIARKTYIQGKESNKDIFKEMIAASNNTNKLDESVGHGTDVLSFTQYHNLLAFRGFGKARNASRGVNDMNSLIDIKPTILKLLKIDDQKSDGISLASYIKGQKVVSKPRMIFVENGLSPKAVTKNNISVRDTVFQGIDMFYVNPKNDELTFKKSAEQKLLPSKERAVFYQDWVLAYYPINAHAMDVVLVNRKTGQWTDDFNTSFAQHSPIKKMTVAIKKFYGNELYV